MRGLQPRPKTPGRSEEEDSGSDDDLGQHDLPGYYFEGPGWSTPRWGTSTFYGSRNVSPAPKQPSLAAPQGMEPLTGVGFSRALPFPAAPQQARYSRRVSACVRVTAGQPASAS